MVLVHRRLWQFVWKPLAQAVAIYLILVVAGLFVVPWFSQKIAQSFSLVQPGFLQSAVPFLSLIAYVLFVWFFSGVLLITATTMLSAMGWDKLSQEVELQAGVTPPRPKVPISVIALDASIRFGFAFLFLFFSLVLGWVCFGIAGVLLAGWLALHDFSAPACLRRGEPAWKQTKSLLAKKQWFGFVIGAGIITLIPVVNVLALAPLVAGGTLLRIQDDPRIDGNE